MVRTRISLYMTLGCCRRRCCCLPFGTQTHNFCLCICNECGEDGRPLARSAAPVGRDGRGRAYPRRIEVSVLMQLTSLRPHLLFGAWSVCVLLLLPAPDASLCASRKVCPAERNRMMERVWRGAYSDSGILLKAMPCLALPPYRCLDTRGTEAIAVHA